jgi:general secretion pathway protein L
VFFAWWFGQLADLFGKWLRPRPPARPDAVIVAPTAPLDEAAEIALALRRAGRETNLGQFGLRSPELDRMPRPANLPVALKIHRADILETTLSLPLAAQRNLDRVLAFEMDRETPFSAEELYWDYRTGEVDQQRGRFSVHLQVLPKTRLAPLLHALTPAGLAPQWAEIVDGPQNFSLLPLDGRHGPPESASRWLMRGAAAACAVLALAAAATPFVRQAVTLARLDREVQAGQVIEAEAAALRREIERLSRAAELIGNTQHKAARPLDVLATVTGLLPDDTYLTELEIRQRKLTLSGRSQAAAQLIATLAADPRFKNPAFAAPVTRVEALRTDVFSIATELEPAP